MRLSGRTAVVTGAARGIGAAEAIRLAQEGANVAVLDLSALTPLETVEAVEAAGDPTPAEQHVIDTMSGRWIIDDADGAARAIRSLAARFEVDEVMVSPVAGAREDDPAGRSPARERTLELLASRLLEDS